MADKKHTAETSHPKPAVMKAANEVRTKSNNLSDEQREDALRHGMQLIYGGSHRGVAAKTGRT